MSSGKVGREAGTRTVKEAHILGIGLRLVELIPLVVGLPEHCLLGPYERHRDLKVKVRFFTGGILVGGRALCAVY